jgi:hypothetical protein
VSIDWTQCKKMHEQDTASMTVEERAAYEKEMHEMAEDLQQWEELEAFQMRCTVHIAPGYSDPEADGCPNCGWGGK